MYNNHEWDKILYILTNNYIADKEAVVTWLVRNSLIDGNLDFVASMKARGLAVERGISLTIENLLGVVDSTLGKQGLNIAKKMINRHLVDPITFITVRDKAYRYERNPLITTEENDALISRLHYLQDKTDILRAQADRK